MLNFMFGLLEIRELLIFLLLMHLSMLSLMFLQEWSHHLLQSIELNILKF